MGNLSRVTGQEFEARIESALVVAKQTGLLLWFAHQQPAFTRSMRPIAKSGADFVGVLRGGAMLAIEAKSVAGDTLDFSRFVQPTGKKPDHGAFTAEQVAHLNAVVAAGGVALLAVEFRASGRRFLVPWDEVSWSRQRVRLALLEEVVQSRWLLPAESSIAERLSKCDGCGAYRAAHGPRRTCCFGAAPPF